MRIFNLMQLTSEQKEQLASRWRSWCRRRASLSRHLAVALRALEGLLPCPQSIPTDFMKWIRSACCQRYDRLLFEAVIPASIHLLEV